MLKEFSVIDEKLKEFFSKFPHTKESKPLQNTLSKKVNNLIKKEVQRGVSQVKAEQKALLNLTGLDVLLSQLENLGKTDYSRYNGFFAKIFDPKLVNELKLKLNQVDEIRLDYRLGDILVLPTNSSNLIVHDFIPRDIGNLHSMVEKIGNVLKITQGPRKPVGILKDRTLLFLPKSSTDFPAIRDQSGDTYINKVPDYCTLDVTAVSNDLLLAHSKLKRVQVDLKSGDTAVSNTPANVFHINAHSRILTSDHVCTREEISYHISSRNIDLESISARNFSISTKSGKITINDLNNERMDLATDTGNVSSSKVSGSSDIKSRIEKISLSIVDKSGFNFPIASRIGNTRINVPKKELLKFKINTKKIGPTDLSLDSIIHDNNGYDEIEGYVSNENPSNSLTIASEIGKAPIRDES